MTKEEKNRKIAEWLGFTREVSHFQPPPLYQDHTEIVWRHPTEDITTGLPDFYRDEAANAMVLEKIASVNAYVWVEWDINEWCVSFLPTTSEDQDPPMEYNNRDRKTAICEAALQLIERQERTA